MRNAAAKMTSAKRRERAKEPTSRAVLMASESVPEFRPPTSQQRVQLGLTVKSRPNVAKAKQAMNHPGECMNGAGSKVTAASANPNMAGNLRDNFHFPAL